MTILNDKEIIQLASEGMITPFVEGSVRISDETDPPHRIISYGTSSFGYDVRLRDEVEIFTNVNGGVLDPKRPKPKNMVRGQVFSDIDGARYVILPPNSYMLGATVEEFDIPRDVMVVCLGKSTYARMAVLCNTTPIEPGFRGNVVIELANGSSLPVRVYLGEGIAQFLFFKGNPCEVSYADRDGKYMGQGMNGADPITHSRV